jgi:hypothetical protein
VSRLRSLALAALFVGAAAAAEVQVPNPILEPEQVWAFDAFTLAPPAGRGWFSLSRTRDRATFGRVTGSLTHAVGAVARAERLDREADSPEALLAIVAERRPKPPADPRFSVVADEVRRDDRDGAWCVAHSLRADDRRAADTTLVVRIVGRTCVHPQARDLVIEAAVSERGRPGELDPETAAFLDRIRLTANGFGPALARAGQSLERGDAAEAARLLEPLAAAGDARAALWLARLLEVGRGVPVDLLRAEQLYRRAAVAGERDALYNLGVLLEGARAGRRDVPEAVRWYRRAADQRDGEAQLNLGLLYFKGDGVPRDHTQAKQWLTLAAANGSERARELLAALSFAPTPWDGLPFTVAPTEVLDPP